MRKATNLRQVLNFFDPELALSGAEELEEWYVARADSPRTEMAVLLQAVDKPQKFLFTGHRGSGKSTELVKLAAELADDVFVVRFSVKDVTDIADLDYVDVMLGMAFELFRQATESRSKVKLSQTVLKGIIEWFQGLGVEEIERKRSGGLQVELNVSAAKLGGRYQQEITTRQKVRHTAQEVGQQSRLKELLNYFIEDVQAKVGRRVLVMVEDLDKADLAKAHEIFYRHSTTLMAPDCSVIYTFPIALRHDNDFVQITHNYNENQSALPNFPVNHRDGSPDSHGREFLKRIVTNRAEETLFEGNSLDVLVEQSGGLPFQLVSLVRGAATFAISRDVGRIDEGAAAQAVLNLRIWYQPLLSTPQLELLRQVQCSKRVENDEEHRVLLHNLSALEYRDDQGVWCDVHPVVAPMLASDGP